MLVDPVGGVKRGRNTPSPRQTQRRHTPSHQQLAIRNTGTPVTPVHQHKKSRAVTKEGRWVRKDAVAGDVTEAEGSVRKLQFEVEKIETPRGSSLLHNKDNGYFMDIDARRWMKAEEERLVECDADGGHYLLRVWNPLLGDQESLELALQCMRQGGALMHA